MDIGRDLPSYNFQQKTDNCFASNPNAKTIPISEQNCTAHPLVLVRLWQVNEPSVSQYQWMEAGRIEEIDMGEVNALESSIETQEDDVILAAAQAIMEKRVT
jgi:hypothetical protein